MTVLGSSAPYDSLADVTSIVRTILADYIQGIKASVSGSVNTNGANVTWVSGDQFSYLLNDQNIVINNVNYRVGNVTSATTLILTTSAGVQAGVGYQAQLPTGDIFSDSQAYVLPTINLAWRKLQKKLAIKGHPRLQKEVDILGIPVIADLDPISQQWMDWTGFWDGAAFTDTPSLPSDFISPLWIKERPEGFTITFRPMKPAGDGLLSQVKGSYNCYFDWREDKIYFPGSLIVMDFKCRYSAYLPDITLTQNSFAATAVPILRASDGLAYYAAEIFVTPRGGTDLAAGFSSSGDKAIDQLTNASTKLGQRASFSRRPWGNRGRGYLTGR